MPIETDGVVAHWDPGQRMMTVWSNFHGPFILHAVVAAGLGLASNQLRLVVPPDIGGSFGIKSGLYPYMVLIGLASRIVGESLEDDARAQRVVDRFLEDLERSEAADRAGVTE